jgi:hypothetical protein
MVARAQSSVGPKLSPAVVAWVVMLAVSLLPDAFFFELAGARPHWLTWAKIGGLAVMAAVTFFWKDVRPLRNYFIILLSIFVGEQAVTWLRATAAWPGRFGGANAPFIAGMWNIQLGRLLVSAMMIGLMRVLGYGRADFFLARGRLDAPIEPVRWLGFPKPDPWTRFGSQWSIYIALGLLAFLIGFGRPSWPAFGQAAWMAPAVLLFAVLNAFNEELTYRSTLLAGLEPILGPRQAVCNAALFFGLGHYFGLPYGVVGVCMASFLGWILGKAMIETRGFFWAWLIHFIQDVLIFSFMAAGSITPGG